MPRRPLLSPLARLGRLGWLARFGRPGWLARLARLATLSLLAPALLLAGCSKPPEKAEVIRPARVMTVARSATDDVKVYAGEVRPRYEIDLSFRIGGKLLERKVDTGAAVRKGQPLARLDPQDARLSAAAAAAQVAAADADVAYARAELDRSKPLLEQKFISQAAYDNKLSAFNIATARRESARAQSAVSGNQAAYTTLVADTDGIVTAVQAEAGQVVTAGQPVMKLARTEEREVAISIAENQAATLKRGTPAQVSLWANPSKIYRGVVREIAPAADALTRTYLVRVSVPDADESLRWGMTANVAIAAGAAGPAGPASPGSAAGTGTATTARADPPGASAIVVPLTAINQQGTQGSTAQVWIVGDNNAVEARTVQIARYLETGAVIAQGLSGGERIVIAGVHKLHPGEVVNPLPPETPTIVSRR